MANRQDKNAQRRADEEQQQLDAQIAQNKQQLAIQKKQAQRKALTNIARSLGSQSQFDSLPDDSNQATGGGIPPNWPNWRGRRSR